MAQPYNHKELEAKWQKVWDDEKAFETSNDYSKPKFYALVEFPYPSGQGLHVGHPRPYTALDIVARKRRMQGYNVLYPMGWDAFGLPTENYAIKNHIHPKIVTKNNVERFKNQRIETDELIRDLIEVSKAIRKNPTIAEYNEHGKYEASVYMRRFGSWNNCDNCRCESYKQGYFR